MRSSSARHAQHDRSVLSRWLPSGFEDIFRSQILRRQAYAAPGAADPSTFSWPELAEVLAAPAPDVLLVAKGERLELPPPKTLAELREYMHIGIGVAARKTERHHERLAAIARAFVAELGAAQVQVFATPGGTHGFGWHYDDEDVFILQTAGIKDYYFRANTVACHVPAQGSAFAEYARETSPLQTARLVPGDFLYIPARWWHVALCEADALSISVGVVPR